MNHAFRLCASALFVAGVWAAPAVAAPATATEPPEPEGFLAEPGILTRAVDFVTRMDGEGVTSKNGFYPELGHMPTGSGWISLGPGYRHWLMNDNAVIDASAAISWRAYKMAQASFEVPRMADNRLLVGTQVLWQDLTQMDFYGYGADSLQANRSQYRLKSTDAVGYADIRLMDQLHTGYSVGWLGDISVQEPSGAFLQHYPASANQFPGDPSFTGAQPNFVYGTASLTYDGRDYRSHPADGSFARVAWTGFDDRSAGGLYTFQRTEVEAMHFMALGTPKIVLAAHGWAIDSSPAAGKIVPAWLQPTLGSANTLRSFDNYRFHDNDMLVLNVETRVALFRHLDAAVFVDAGNVAPKFSALNLDQRSYGAGLRVHTRKMTFGRLDVAHGTEGWMFLARWSDPFQFSRMREHTAPAPFVP